MLLGSININWSAQDIVNVFIKVVTLLVKQNSRFLAILGIVAVIGAFLLISFGVCFGMCFYAFTKRRSKRLCMFCVRSCSNLCCDDELDVEEGFNDRRNDEEYMIGNGESKKHSHTYGPSEYFDGKNSRGSCL